MTAYDRPVNEHYGRGDLAAKILEALRAAGKDPDAPTFQALAPVDQLHARGREATLELARLAGITPGMRVLDVGGGLGGPARTLPHPPPGAVGAGPRPQQSPPTRGAARPP